jgi:hypothetical protein
MDFDLLPSRQQQAARPAEVLDLALGRIHFAFAFIALSFWNCFAHDRGGA